MLVKGPPPPFSSAGFLNLVGQSWEVKTAKARRGTDYLLLHRIRCCNHLRLGLYLILILRICELRISRKSQACHSFSLNEKRSEGWWETRIKLGLDSSLCSCFLSMRFRGWLPLQALLCSSFCSCNTVLREHSPQRNNMILAETQLSSSHSTTYISAQSPLQVFTETSRLCSIPSGFPAWPAGSDYYRHHITSPVASTPVPRAIHLPHSQVSLFRM